MWTQRDQIQAYQFLRRRLVSALVSADANHPISPSRRLVMGSVLGLIATLIATAAFGIIGVIKPSTSSDWKKPGQVVIEKETGTRFVITADGALHPVLNYASARLLAGGDGSKTSTVPAKQLAELGRGAPLGILGAPDSIPAANRISAGPLVVCSVGSNDSPAAQAPATVVRWSSTMPGTALGPNSLLVTDGRSEQVVNGGYRYRVPGPAQAASLQLAAASEVTVSSAWLSVLPSGGDLDFIAVNGAGQPGPTVNGKAARIGAVLVVPDSAGSGQFYLVLKAGIAPVTPVQAQLAVNAPQNAAANPSHKPVAISAAALVGVPTAALPPALAEGQTLTGLPRLVTVVGRSSPVCLGIADGGAVTASVGGPTTDVVTGASAPAATSALGASAIAIAPGTGGLVENRSSGTAETLYLLADDGVKYPVPTAAAQAALGYSKVTPVVLSDAALALLPTGPALDPAAATTEVR